MSQQTTQTREAENGHKRSGRRPEGPAHARKGSALQTLKRTLVGLSASTGIGVWKRDGFGVNG